jgi:hypothetical protein
MAWIMDGVLGFSPKYTSENKLQEPFRKKYTCELGHHHKNINSHHIALADVMGLSADASWGLV